MEDFDFETMVQEGKPLRQWFKKIQEANLVGWEEQHSPGRNPGVSLPPCMVHLRCNLGKVS